MPVHSNVRPLIDKLNQERVRQGFAALKQAEIASSSGVSQSVISTLYAGKSKRIDFETIDKLCGFFSCEPGDLFLREVSPLTSGDQ